MPARELRLDVLAHDGRHLVVVEGVFGQYQRGAPGVALLARLEESQQRPGEVGFGGQVAEHAVEHGGVHVVAAGVHHPLPLRGARQIGPLRDGQRVDVGAQHHGPTVARSRAAPHDAGQYARAGDRAVLDAQCGELLGDEVGGAVLLEREFGVGVQVAAECDGGHVVL